MQNLQKISGYAALLNSIVSLAMLTVVFGLIGIAALSDKQKLVDLALNDPLPLILQDALKVLSAVIATALVLAFNDMLKNVAPVPIAIATAIGLLSVVCLVINAGLSFYAVSSAEQFASSNSQIGIKLNFAVGLLGMVVIVLNGIWYLVTSWQAKKSQRLPNALANLGLAMGILSLVPPLGIIVLLMSVVWSMWLSRIFLAAPNAG